MTTPDNQRYAFYCFISLFLSFLSSCLVIKLFVKGMLRTNLMWLHLIINIWDSINEVSVLRVCINRCSPERVIVCHSESEGLHKKPLWLASCLRDRIAFQDLLRQHQTGHLSHTPPHCNPTLHGSKLISLCMYVCRHKNNKQDLQIMQRRIQNNETNGCQS